MHHVNTAYPPEKPALYDLLTRQLTALLEDCPQPLPALANCAALLYHALPEINWAGFYLLQGDRLLLGPFQGNVACTVIPMGRGVCGTAAATHQVQLVPDVHAFPGHIACDSASNAEIVVPLLKDGRLMGVLDIDSPILARFDNADAAGLTTLASLLMDATTWEDGLL